MKKQTSVPVRVAQKLLNKDGWRITNTHNVDEYGRVHPAREWRICFENADLGLKLTKAGIGWGPEYWTVAKL